eukprot:3616432-Rhodomonas_salina.1
MMMRPGPPAGGWARASRCHGHGWAGQAYPEPLSDGQGPCSENCRVPGSARPESPASRRHWPVIESGWDMDSGSGMLYLED